MQNSGCKISAPGSRLKGSESGIALMLVLWVLVLLSIIVFEFCSTMRIEATITKNFKEGERSYYLAQAGINRAFIELIKTQRAVKKFKGAKDSMVDNAEEDELEDDETEDWKPREEPYLFELEDGECEVTIGDEGGKINLNWIAKKAKSDRKLLTDIIEKSCGLEGEEKDIIVDSIIDWVDKDHNHLMNGAEDEYYESLEEPYESRDGNFVIPGGTAPGQGHNRRHLLWKSLWLRGRGGRPEDVDIIFEDAEGLGHDKQGPLRAVYHLLQQQCD